MNRREFLCFSAFASGSLLLTGPRAASPADRVPRASPQIAKLDKPLAEWHKLLPPAAFAVLFEEDTERPFSSPLNAEKRAGTYVCAACYLPLFEAKTKFDSGTGWPSFYRPIAGHVGTKEDRILFFPRTEYHCARCGGHQGHLFDDGPKPTGQRWCNNGLALAFVPAGQPLPPLRI
jgi:peptide-methionine (R)-S-oxide reductase